MRGTRGRETKPSVSRAWRQALRERDDGHAGSRNMERVASTMAILVAVITLGDCSTPSHESVDMSTVTVTGASTDARCLAMTREYQGAIVDALVCDPSAQNACDGGRPLVVARQDPDGRTTPEGLCAPPCLAAVSASRAAALDGILKRFEAQGCTYARCWCPGPAAMPPRCLESGVCWGIASPHVAGSTRGGEVN